MVLNPQRKTRAEGAFHLGERALLRTLPAGKSRSSIFSQPPPREGNRPFSSSRCRAAACPGSLPVDFPVAHFRSPNGGGSGGKVRSQEIESLRQTNSDSQLYLRASMGSTLAARRAGT
jgi:hypothetical protein